ncbi:unnamed protein product [Phytomonas sp. EM1]|nr:unnamed protein product [Phytomonas sp. EM1]|eukprot:CCW59873.1 unnamed protein product [Phytomonas sp. isolate EM1]
MIPLLGKNLRREGGTTHLPKDRVDALDKDSQPFPLRYGGQRKQNKPGNTYIKPRGTTRKNTFREFCDPIHGEIGVFSQISDVGGLCDGENTRFVFRKRLKTEVWDRHHLGKGAHRERSRRIHDDLPGGQLHHAFFGPAGDFRESA